MNQGSRTIDELLSQLPPDRYVEVLDFIEFLLSKESPPPNTKMKLDWAGGLADLREQYTSLELQQQINKWREEDETAN